MTAFNLTSTHPCQTQKAGVHQADGSIGLRYPRPVAQPSSPGRRNKVRVATWNPVTCADGIFETGRRTDEMRLSCALCTGVHTRNLNGSRHENYATSLDTDDFYSLAAIGTFIQIMVLAHGLSCPGPQLAQLVRYHVRLRRNLPFGFIQEEGGCVCVLEYSVERSPLWPIVIRKLCEKLSLNPYSVHGGSKSKEERVGGWKTGSKKEKKTIAPSSPPPNQ